MVQKDAAPTHAMRRAARPAPAHVPATGSPPAAKSPRTPGRSKHGAAHGAARSDQAHGNLGAPVRNVGSLNGQASRAPNAHAPHAQNSHVPHAPNTHALQSAHSPVAHGGHGHVHDGGHGSGHGGGEHAGKQTADMGDMLSLSEAHELQVRLILGVISRITVGVANCWRCTIHCLLLANLRNRILSPFTSSIRRAWPRSLGLRLMAWRTFPCMHRGTGRGLWSMRGSRAWHACVCR